MHSFDVNNDGAWPWGELIQGSDGNIYGVARTGGQFGGGTVYRMDNLGNVTVLHSFGNGYDGSAPAAGVVQGSDGALYGTTEQGPGYSNFASGGVVFRLDVGLSPGDQAPAITSASATTFTVGSAGTFSVTTTGTPTVVAITETGALPSGVTFTNNRNGTATLSGTPAAGTSGTYALTITAENGRLPNATQSFTLTVSRASQTITVTQAPPATAVFNATFSVAATASSGTPVAIGGSGACSVSAGTVTMTSGTGICTVTFEQAGDANYAVAPQVMYSTTAQKAVPTVSLTGGTFPFDGASHGAVG